jgi:23S rRNA (cytosine1962-C5)-methyltransferase
VKFLSSENKNRDFYKKKINLALKKRQSFLLSKIDNCFRLINGVGDGIPDLTIDYYNKHILVQYFSANLYKDKSDIADALLDTFSDSVASILIKNRTIQKDISQIKNSRESELIYGEFPNEKFYVVHNGINLYADLVHSQNTGIFMDMRNIRNVLSAYYSEISSLLNLFSYTSAFAIHSKKFGVSTAINVDISSAVLDRSKLNYKLNNYTIDNRDFFKSDALKAIKILSKKNKTFDLIILDPPTFSRKKKNHFSIKKDYTKYCNEIERLHPKYVLTAVNTISIAEKEFFSFHPENWKNIFFLHEDIDFPYKENPYLKCALWKVE